ncbi:hypothetical protein J5X84_18030 [Streptosporangiaceae bacterium NEAU-GS5]|nr:hypothetical protein [Streptosporangiaceae bacterium NEAU-GS5]
MTVTAVTPQARVSSKAFDWLVLAGSSWIIAGGYLDAWAHQHGKVDDTFFTPWHGLLYAGLVVTGLILTIRGLLSIRAGLSMRAGLSLRAGRAWREALPYGYGLSFVGCVLFLVFGALDLGWHTLFGIEANVAALLSPTHLGLMASGFLAVSGPWRADRGPTTSYVAVLSASLVVAEFWFFAQYDIPYSSPWPGIRADQPAFLDLGTQLGIDGVIVATVTVMGVLLFLLRDRPVPPGTVTLLVGIPATLNVLAVDPPSAGTLIGAAVLGGILGDVALRLTGAGGLGLRVASALIPLLLWSVYMAAVQIAYGMQWEIHLWTGTIVVSAAVGYLLSFLAVPPASRR